MTLIVKKKHIILPDLTTFQSRILTDGPSYYWPLDDLSGSSAKDLIGGKTGFAEGGILFDQPGVSASSRCMTFNGTNARIQTPDNVLLTVPFTVEVWIKASPTGGVNRGYFNNWGSGDNFGMKRLAAGDLGFDITTTIGQSSANSTVYPTDGAWHHVAAVFPGGTSFLKYLDTVQSSFTMLAPIFATPANKRIEIGAGIYDTFSWWLGSIQDVVIFPRVLSPAEITSHYNLRFSSV